MFWWATADGEPIIPENIDLLESTHKEMKKIGYEWATGEVFVCRVRKMRPQQPAYPKDRVKDKVLCDIYDSCGPVRDRKEEG